VLPPLVADYVWSARQESGTVTLTGFYPDDATRQAMRSVISLKFPGARVDDKLVIASGAPAGLGAAAQLGLTQLGLLETGSASVDAKKLTLTGMASSDAIANDVKAAIAKGAGGLPGDANITFRPAPVAPPAAIAAPAPVAAPVAATPVTPAPAAPKAPPVIAAQPTAPAPTTPPRPQAPAVAAVKPTAPKPTAPTPSASAPAVASGDACEQDLGTAMKASRILFESSSAVLRKESQPVLLQIAAAIKRCGDRKIGIGGHTDSTGTPGFNETLSKNRAKAVADVLVKTGIPMSRLQVTGYGPAQPVAPNDTVAGKLQNRRIEFSLVR
jgi:outer membrane protein OmpA-like peptidoglycan-associated protein